MQVNSDRYLPRRFAVRQISTKFTDIEVNNRFSLYHTSWPKKITLGKQSLFLFICSEENSTLLITAEITNHCARKAATHLGGNNIIIDSLIKVLLIEQQ